MADSLTENINIELGDIIELIAPDNDNYNQQNFYIKYLDKSKIS